MVDARDRHAHSRERQRHAPASNAMLEHGVDATLLDDGLIVGRVVFAIGVRVRVVKRIFEVG